MTDRPKKLSALWRRFSQCNSRKLPPLDAPPPVPSSPIAAAANTTVIMIDGGQPKNRRKPCAPASESPPSDPELLSLDDAEIAAVQDAVSNDADAAHPVGDLPVRVETQGSAPSSEPDQGDHRQRTLDPILRKTTPDYGSFFDGRVHAADRRSYRSNLRIKTESDCLYDEMTEEAAVHRSGHQLHFADDDSLCDAIVLRMERERRRRRAHSTHFEMRTPEDHLLKSGSSEAESTSRPLHRQTLQREGLSRSMPKLVQSMRITRQQAERRLPARGPRPAQSWLHIPQLPASSGCNGFVHAMNNFPPGQHHSSRHPLQGPARNVFAYTTMQPVRQAHKYPQMPDWQQQSQYGYHLQQHPQLSQSTRRVRRQESVCTSENLADYSSQRERQLQDEVYQEAPDDPGYFQQFHQPMSVQQTPVFVIPNVAAAPTMKLVSQAQWPAGFGAVPEPTSTESPDPAGPPRRKSVAGRNCMLGWMLAVTAIIILALAIALFVQVSRDAQELNQLRAAVAEDYQFEQTHHSGGQGLIKPTKPS